MEFFLIDNLAIYPIFYKISFYAFYGMYTRTII